MDKQRIYIPIIKTTDAEIKGYQYLESSVKRDIMPLFELTRSRPLKGYPAGDIHRRMEQLREITINTPFILDLTSHEDLMNPQIEDLLDDTNGFQEWRAFLNRYSDLQIIPVLHLYDEDLSSFQELARRLMESHQTVALRATHDTAPEDLQRYLTAISSIVDLGTRLLLIIDADYIDEGCLARKAGACETLVRVGSSFGVGNMSLNSSSFPSVVKSRGGGDSSGAMPILELQLYSDICRAMGGEQLIHYGDYGAAHPLRYSMMGGNWVPRVDLSLDESYVYCRYRRDDGGYERAATALVNSTDYDPVDCWGKQQIELAATGDLPGKSPTFWISVRINQHLTRFSVIHADL